MILNHRGIEIRFSIKYKSLVIFIVGTKYMYIALLTNHRKASEIQESIIHS
ncbi:hypothetical protein GW891_01785 [bacterium]|nr:hypothetical protein [bacterium]